MVYYECLMTTRNTASFAQLTKIVKQISHKVVEEGGIVRSIQNHGIRPLPYRFKAKYPDKEGNRYYKKGRFVSVFYDASPNVLKDVDGMLQLEEQVLRNTHLKARNKLWYVNIAKETKNPYIQRVLDMEQQEEEEEALTQKKQQQE
eukprot:CAMPEP_0184864830 /NCGR_PEP_ID=MMETSP0580-20130426/16114_1 /TAXON_ID=1118495 /ORGANISM="Dactyliosolen fragilissimus" /LENGTH=145 /DNA_ID=CAMNT_0027363751 /DNA_START=115 /DNA_END=552 /DNA_ORIENTATION=-